MKKNQNGSSVIEGLLILVVVGILGSVGLYVWQQSHSKTTNDITSFEACKSANNPIMETYPEQCSANGRTFTNSKQTANTAPQIISQGVKGTITLRSGGCMPVIDPSNNSCEVETYTSPSKVIIKKTLDLTNKENKEVVKELNDVKGSFATELPVGLYNMYVVYQDKEYCNLFGGQRGEDCEFSVEANKVTEYTLEINTAID